jgi:hypothetical protein
MLPPGGTPTIPCVEPCRLCHIKVTLIAWLRSNQEFLACDRLHTDELFSHRGSEGCSSAPGATYRSDRDGYMQDGSVIGATDYAAQVGEEFRALWQAITKAEAWRKVRERFGEGWTHSRKST